MRPVAQPDKKSAEDGACNASPESAFGKVHASEISSYDPNTESSEGKPYNFARLSELDRLGGSLAVNLLLSANIRLKDGLGNSVCLCLVHADTFDMQPNA